MVKYIFSKNRSIALCPEKSGRKKFGLAMEIIARSFDGVSPLPVPVHEKTRTQRPKKRLELPLQDVESDRNKAHQKK
jgi:hypothetical protein